VSRTTELLATVVAAGAGAGVAVIAVGANPLLVLPAVTAVALVALLTRRASH